MTQWPQQLCSLNERPLPSRPTCLASNESGPWLSDTAVASTQPGYRGFAGCGWLTAVTGNGKRCPGDPAGRHRAMQMPLPVPWLLFGSHSAALLLLNLALHS